MAVNSYLTNRIDHILMQIVIASGYKVIALETYSEEVSYLSKGFLNKKSAEKKQNIITKGINKVIILAG